MAGLAKLESKKPTVAANAIIRLFMLMTGPPNRMRVTI
jgi:hypothetical protein